MMMMMLVSLQGKDKSSDVFTVREVRLQHIVDQQNLRITMVAEIMARIMMTIVMIDMIKLQ